MKRTIELLNELEREHVEQALRILDAGVSTLFAESTKYDVVVDGKTYPPKRVAGLALELLTGRRFGPDSFKGGQESGCFRSLRRCGFTVVRKGEAIGSLIPLLKEVLDLQTQYSSANTLEMERRGILIRQLIPALIASQIGRIEPLFTTSGFSAQVQGSDGIGRKVESPWVRIFDELMSPSATLGWYLVLHFSRDGSTFYATLGCGSTTFIEGSLVPVPPIELAKNVGWARDAAKSSGLTIDDLRDSMRLNGNGLSKQFEFATAFAKAFAIDTLDEAKFWLIVHRLAQILVFLYEKERLGQSPLAAQPEILGDVAEIQRLIAGRSGARNGQGRNLSFAERSAIENRAMIVARECLRGAGFESIQDVHATKSFDFEAQRDSLSWAIEVKGTTSTFMDCFLLTAPELRLHRSRSGQTALVLVRDIQLSRSVEGDVIATGGKVELQSPWKVDEWVFEATAFRAKRMSNKPSPHTLTEQSDTPTP